mgnify:CR=1 FL=1
MTKTFIDLTDKLPVSEVLVGIMRHTNIQNTDLLPQTPEETEKTERLLNADKRHALKQSQTALKLMMSDYLSAPAGSFRIGHDEYGAPVLLDPENLNVSVSRASGWTALALSADSRIGIDIETPETIDWRKMLAMTSDTEEAQLLSKYMESDRTLHPFYRAWTLKEAVMKTPGTGFAFGPKRICVPECIISAHRSDAYIDIEAQSFLTVSFEEQNVIGAIALTDF